MNRLIALIRREYWENKGAFRTTPLVIGGIYIAFLLMSIFTTTHIDSDLYTFREAVRVMGEQPEALRGSIMYQGMLGSSVLFTVVMSFVVFFYLLGSLYDDRKDRSILFQTHHRHGAGATDFPDRDDPDPHHNGAYRFPDGAERRCQSLDFIPQRCKSVQGLGDDRSIVVCPIHMGSTGLWLAIAGLCFRTARTPVIRYAATADFCHPANLDRIPANVHTEEQHCRGDRQLAIQ